MIPPFLSFGHCFIVSPFFFLSPKGPSTQVLSCGDLSSNNGLCRSNNHGRAEMWRHVTDVVWQEPPVCGESESQVHLGAGLCGHNGSFREPCAYKWRVRVTGIKVQMVHPPGFISSLRACAKNQALVFDGCATVGWCGPL